MSTAALMPKEVAVLEASAEDCIMVDDEKESPSPSTKAAPTKTPTTVQGGKKRKPAEKKGTPTPMGPGIAAFMVHPTPATASLLGYLSSRPHSPRPVYRLLHAAPFVPQVAPPAMIETPG
jgi:hypothetical protein